MMPTMKTIACLILFTAFASGQGRPLNVVFFLADDLGWKDLGCFGSSFYETPHLDALCARGKRFTQAYAACPVCSPTRASIMAGKYPARMDTTDFFGGRRRGRLLPASYHQRLALDEVTMAEAFRGAGYATAFLGKWHLGPEGHWPEQQGFDLNAGGWRAGHPYAGYFAPWKKPRLKDSPKGTYLTDRLTDDACAWIGKVKDRPFFMYFAYYQVHTPLQGKKELIARHRERKEKLPAAAGPKWRPEGRRKCRQVQDYAVYAAMVQSMDDSVGRVVERVRDLGLLDRTAFVFMSDNGGLSTSEGHPTSNVPLRAGKGWLYEGGIREPMFIVWPGGTKVGSVCDTPVTSTDFYPTLLEMCGLPSRPDQHTDGTSLVPLLRGGDRLAPRDLYWHYPHYGNQGGAPSGAIRSGDHKLIEWFEDGRVELYDLGADLSEQRNLAAALPERARELRTRLADWRRSVDAKMPRPNPDWKGRRK
ncbi:MAG: sulfatase [Planctomycetes bacterium]|nr:sulfatase [Planctomycetota bacterium]